MKKKLSLVLCLVMLISSIAGTFVFATDDISEHWAEEIISKWIEAGKVKGYEDGSFRPDNNMTRAEFATILASVIDINIAEYAEMKFEDVNESDWYYEYVRKLFTLKIIAEDVKFNPNNNITRQDVMTMVGRAFYYQSQDFTVLEQFADYGEISDYAKEFAAALVENKNVSGYEDNTIRPLRNITRAECVKILDGFNIIKDPYSLEGIMQRIYEGVDVELPSTMTMEITKENSEYFLGIKEMEFEEALVSEPMMGSVAHSICLVRVKDGSDIESIKEEIRTSVNPRKWVCVGIERDEVIVENQGNLILLVMDTFAPEQFKNTFLSLDVERKN